MKTLSPFNTGKQILSYFEFEKWRKSKSLFTLPDFMENILIGIAGISLLAGGVVLVVTILGGLMKGFAEVSFIWALYAFLPLFFLTSAVFATELIKNIISSKYETKMLQKMDEKLLKKFVHTLLNDAYSSDDLKIFSHYDSLVLANHQDKPKMIELAYKCMEEFKYSYDKKILEQENERLKKEKALIIEKFRSDTLAHDSN
jgi:hypothetical protein